MLVIIFLCFTAFLGALEEDRVCDFNLKRTQATLSVEEYHVTRMKDLGTRQHGMMTGFRLQLERFKRYGWYVGLEGYSARGSLSGHTGGGAALSSNFIEQSIEGRFGYTFQCKEGLQASITPYVGGGGYCEKNNFSSPSPLHAHFRTRYGFISFGFLTAIYPCSYLELGFNAKMRYPFSPKCRVTHDPHHDSLTQRMGDRVSYRFELPFTYRIERMAIGLMPFYETRLYGGQPNYPFDFIRTRFVDMGAALNLIYQW